MVIVKINNMRLNDLIYNLEECLEDINFAIEKLEATDENVMMLRMINNSIRCGIASIFTNCEDYLGMILKKNGVGVTDKSLRDCLRISIEQELIESNFGNCIIKAIKMRNSFSHRYNVPTTEELINFYTENKENFYKQLEFMKSLSSTNISYCDVFDF